MENNGHEFTKSLLNDLSINQKEAVLTNENRLLVLAGAGSGKTKTLINRILFLIFNRNVDPSDILAITFTKNAANEMIDRLIIASDQTNKYKEIIDDKRIASQEKDTERKKYLKKYKWIGNITVKTFHSFCYSLLREHGAKSFDNRFKLIVDSSNLAEAVDTSFSNVETPKEIIQKLIKDLANDKKYLLDLKQYILDYYVDKLHKRKESHPFEEGLLYTTLKGEKVRSKSERLIADWFYRHEIDYIFEPEVNISGEFTFYPDFFIPSAGLYIEHLSNLSYSLKDKIDEFNKGDILVVRTYESLTHDIRKFYESLENIVKGRINIEINPETSLKFEEEFFSYKQDLNLYIDEVLRVIDKIKVEGLDYKHIVSKGRKDKHERVSTFYILIEPLIEKYISFCITNSYLDFNDLILEADTALIDHEDIREFYQNRFKYILVDEFQDVNSLQVRLIKHLLTNHSHLFCVGDDWQSIYGFRGSEVQYILDFEKHFAGSKTIHLDINYRSNDTIVKASNIVISNNKHKIKKEIKAFNEEGKKINLYAAQLEVEDGVEVTYNKILQLSELGFPKEEILILFRRHAVFKPYWEKLRNIKDKFSYKTIHASKGLEAKIVFIIGLTGSDYGFPFMMESDRIFQIFKPVNSNLLLEEERRLFYVAMTRAREQLYLVSELGNESEFIEEITNEYLDRENFLTLNFDKNTHKCINCGFEISKNFQYCPMCGQSIKKLIENVNTNLVQDDSINDDCLKSAKAYLIPAQEETETSMINDEKALDYTHTIISCLNQIDGLVGRSMLSNILRGTLKDEDPKLNYLFSLGEFGAFSKISRSEVINLIDGLIKETMLIKFTSQEGSTPGLPLLKVTLKGLDYINTKKY